MHTGRYIQGETYWLAKVRPISVAVQIFGLICVIAAAVWHPPQVTVSAQVIMGVVITVLGGAYWTSLSKSLYRLELGACLSILSLSIGFRSLAWATPEYLFISLVLAVIITLVLTCLFNRTEIYLFASSSVWIIFVWGMGAEVVEHPLFRWLVLIWGATSILSISGHYLFSYLRMANLKTSSALHELAFIDELTDIDNRRCFLARTGDLLDSQTADCYFMMIDIDDFKSINDRFGHEEGDIVLRQVGLALKTLAGPMPCGRIGGEEFGLIFQGAEVDLKAFAGTLSSTIAQCSTDRYVVTVSIGIAVMESATSVSTIMRMADNALYGVKSQGKNSFALFSPSLSRV